MPISPGIKAAIDRWSEAAQITEGRIFRAVNKADRIGSDSMSDQARLLCARRVRGAARREAGPHDLRRTFAQLALKGNSMIEQIQIALGHTSIATTERYLGSKLDLNDSPSDHIRLKILTTTSKGKSLRFSASATPFLEIIKGIP